MNFLLKYRRTFILALVDAFTVFAASALSYVLLEFLMRTSELIPSIDFRLFPTLVHGGIISLCSVAALCICGAYKRLWRYANIKDLSLCVGGMVLSLCFYYIISGAARLQYSDIHTAFTVSIGTVGIITVRICYNLLYARMHREASDSLKKRTLVVGAGDACNRVIAEMLGGSSIYLPVAIVDDDIEKQGRVMHGITVRGSVDDIPVLVEKYKINTIFIAIPSITGEAKKRIINICSETVCEVKVIPYIHKMLDNSKLMGMAQNIDIEDLLGREVVRFDDTEVRDMVCGRVCMVTGGGGSIGSELCRQLAEYGPKKLIIVDIYENNAYDIQQELLARYKKLDLDVRIASVRDYDKMKVLFEMFKPEIVCHAAAHKHVPLMETSPEEAIKNNIFGTLNTARLANEYGTRKFVLVSTDKAVNPTNVMGATKRCCEMIVQYFAQKSKVTEFVAVRFGNVLGSNGSVIPLFEKQIASGGPLTVTHPDIIRYFMTIPEAVSLILQAGTIAKGGEIFVLDMGEPVKILSLAENLIKLHGKEPYKEIDIEFTGLRPGEKLFEELLMSEEGLKETQNKKIFIGTQIEIEEEEFHKSLKVIWEKAQSNNSDAVVEELRRLVPTFNHVVLNK